MLKSQYITCLQQHGLNVIAVDNKRTNIVLTTIVTVNTDDNQMSLVYKVGTYDDGGRNASTFEPVRKSFDIYSDAVEWYNKMVDLYGTK